ncbi:MAG TPA: hypothetical protein VMT00_10210 [Thermoanaerobaculia bacterium]|nr:hypothetical protein [Thermoanaerobaculia bacterium]
MRRTVVFGVVVAVIVLWSGPARAACDFLPAFSGAYRSTPLGAAIDADTLFVADSYGVILYDRSFDPPRPVSSIALPGTTGSIELASGRIYVASGSAVHVLRRSGRYLESVAAVEIGAAVSSLLHVSGSLFVAAANGITQLDLVIPDQPLTVGTRLPTTAGGAFSMAVMGSFLYVADGDSTLDVFSLAIVSLPQATGTIPSLPRTTSVRSGGQRLFASDGQQSAIFAGSGTSLSRIADLPLGSSVLVPVDSNVFWMAGTDRQLRAVDLRDPLRPVVLCSEQLPISGGTVNRITSLTGGGERLYVTAGDAGVVALATRDFREPYPIRAHLLGPHLSIFSFGDTVVSAPATRGLEQFGQSDAGALTTRGVWEGNQVWMIHDGVEGGSMRILASSGARLSLWDLAPTPPAVISTVELRAAVRDAVLIDASTAWATLVDRSLWRIDLSSATASLSQITVPGASPSFIARSGAAIALADLDAAGTTTVRFFANGDPSAAAATAILQGAATSGIALSSSGKVAAVTFAGILQADFAVSPPAIEVISSIDPQPAVALQYTGASDLFVLRSSELERWNTVAKQQIARLPLTGDASAFHVHAATGIASIATGLGITSILYERASAVPEAVAVPSWNRYYRKLFRVDEHLYLFDGRSVTVHSLSARGLPTSSREIALGGSVVDVAAAGDAIFALEGNGRLTRYEMDGSATVSLTIDDAGDLVPLSVTDVAGTLWVGISRGCLSGNCEKKTIVVDASGGQLSRAGELPGALVDSDIGEDGGTAYALFDLPAEIRVLDLRNPLAPAVLASRASEGNPVSIAHSPAEGSVYALGNRLYGYTLPSLDRFVEMLEPFTPDPSQRVSYLDQRIRVDGDCAIVSGRRFAPEMYGIAPDGWTFLRRLVVPAAGRGIVFSDGEIHVLTDYSLEILTSGAAPRRRRAVR